MNVLFFVRMKTYKRESTTYSYATEDLKNAPKAVNGEGKNLMLLLNEFFPSFVADRPEPETIQTQKEHSSFDYDLGPVWFIVTAMLKVYQKKIGSSVKLVGNWWFWWFQLLVLLSCVNCNSDNDD